MAAPVTTSVSPTTYQYGTVVVFTGTYTTLGSGAWLVDGGGVTRYASFISSTSTTATFQMTDSAWNNVNTGFHIIDNVGAGTGSAALTYVPPTYTTNNMPVGWDAHTFPVFVLTGTNLWLTGGWTNCVITYTKGGTTVDVTGLATFTSTTATFPIPDTGANTAGTATIVLYDPGGVVAIQTLNFTVKDPSGMMTLLRCMV